MIYFTADQHFGDSNIIGYCDRPFRDADEMDDAIIATWNDTVKNDDDDVFVLGDFSFMEDEEPDVSFIRGILSKLRGRKHLIVGNHDKLSKEEYQSAGFISYHYPYLIVEDFICVHDPALSCIDRSKKFLCGHIHDLFIKKKNCLNVGVDVHDFTPISIEDCKTYFF